jgi:hypothetical protein
MKLRPHPEIDDVSYWSTRIMAEVKDYKDLLNISAILKDRAIELQTQDICNKKLDGMSWTEIGKEIGISKQAAWQKYINKILPEWPN